jgi:hypothetical protein
VEFVMADDNVIMDASDTNYTSPAARRSFFIA